MKPKIFIVAIIVLIISVSFAGFLYGKRQASNNIEPKKNTPLAETAPDLGRYKQPAGVIFSFISKPDLPPTMPVYEYQTISQFDLRTAAANLSAQLGFTATPSAVKKGAITITKWIDPGTASFVYTESDEGTSFSYQRAKSLPGTKPSLPESSVKEFISLFGKQIGATDFNIEPSANIPDGILILDTPQPLPLHNFSFKYTYNAYSVAARPMNISGGSVISDNDGIIRSASIKAPLVVKNQIGSIAILTPEQILASVTQGRGTLISSNDVQSPELGAVPTFTSFQISSVELFYSPRSGQLLPAILVSGVGRGVLGKSQSATFFLWAFPAAL